MSDGHNTTEEDMEDGKCMRLLPRIGRARSEAQTEVMRISSLSTSQLLRSS